MVTPATASGILLYALVASAGCGTDDDRDTSDAGPSPPGDSDGGTADGGDPDDPGDGSSGAEDDGEAQPDVGPDDDTSGDDDGSGDGDDPPPDDDEGLPTLPWNCAGFQPNYPTERPYHTAKELCAWINDCRKAYSFHSRYPCGGQEVDPGQVTPDAVWPIEMTWDSAVAADAQAEADALAAGASPSGRMREAGGDVCAQYGDYRLWLDSIDDEASSVSRPYTVTARDNDEAWTTRCSALGTGFAFFRIGLAYVDDCGDPIVTKFGCGVADAADGRAWAVVRFLP
jgi:hypothetical protein